MMTGIATRHPTGRRAHDRWHYHSVALLRLSSLASCLSCLHPPYALGYHSPCPSAPAHTYAFFASPASARCLKPRSPAAPESGIVSRPKWESAHRIAHMQLNRDRGESTAQAAVGQSSQSLPRSCSKQLHSIPLPTSCALYRSTRPTPICRNLGRGQPWAGSASIIDQRREMSGLFLMTVLSFICQKLDSHLYTYTSKLPQSQ
jgi:hypothetical protein